MTELLQDSAAIRHAILYAQAGAVFSKACTAFKNGMLGGVGENQLTPNQPSFTTPGAPEKFEFRGVFLQKNQRVGQWSAIYSIMVG